MSGNHTSWILSCLRTSCLILIILSTICRTRKTKLYIAGFFPTSLNIPEGSIGRGVLPAAYLALQHINSSSWLHNYNLNLVWNDTKCDTAVGMKVFFDMLYDKIDVPKVILFGDACHNVTDPVAKASRFFHLIQLSYADTHPMYTTESYPNFFRIVPSEAAFNPARVALLQHFNWTRVGTIYQNSPRFSLPHSKLLTELDKAGVEIAAAQSIAEELRPDSYLQKLKDKDVRIILGNFDEVWARRIFCQAYRNGLFGRRYQWIIAGLYEEKWWEIKDKTVDCTPEELLLALEGHITTDVLPLSSAQETTETGITSSEYEAQYNKKRGGEYSKFHGYAYDGILAIARAIREVNTKLHLNTTSSKPPKTFESFRYRDPVWAQLFKESLNKTSFIGVTGNVSFEHNERKGYILLSQFQGKSAHKIGEYNSNNNLLVLNGAPLKWKGGTTPPVDRTTIVTIPSRVSITLFIVISIFAVLGIIMAFVFLAMNIKYRNQRYIKMSSPYLNNLIIIGCILTYTSVILLGLDSGLTSESNFPYICAGRAWVLMSGFTLAFGSMFSKTWRVHAIFTDIKLNKKLIKDYKLFMVVGILVFIDVATLTTWQIVDPFYRDTKKGTPEPSPQNEDIWIVPEMEFCQSKEMTIFLGSIYVYKGLLMAFGIFLAWETRHVSIPALNDSKYIGMSVYNVVIMCVIGAGLSFMLREQQDAAFVIISIFIIFCSTATLCLVFVPKLIELKRNPQAGDRRVRTTLKPFKKSRRDSDEMELHTRIKVITDDNFRFRQRLKEKTYELEALMFRLRGLEESTAIILTQSETHQVISSSTHDITEKEFIELREVKSDSAPHESCKQPAASFAATPTEICSNGLYQRKALDSCPSLSQLSKLPAQNQSEDEGAKHASSELLPLRALSLIERVGGNRAVRFSEINSRSNSQKSSNSSSNSSISYKQSDFQSPTSVDEQFIKINPQVAEYQTLESDDNSYAKAIKANSLRKNTNGYSSSCEEDDTDRYEAATHSEASDSSRPSTRRRTRSLGGLMVDSSVAGLLPNSDSAAATVAHSNSTSQHLENTFIRLIPYFNRNNNGQHTLRSGSSCPQVRCDIVEYL